MEVIYYTTPSESGSRTHKALRIREDVHTVYTWCSSRMRANVENPGG